MARLGEAIGYLVHHWPDEPRVAKLLDSYHKWYEIGGVPNHGTPKWNHGVELSDMCSQLASYLQREDRDSYYNADDSAAAMEVSSMTRSRSDRGVEFVGRVTVKGIASTGRTVKRIGRWLKGTGIPATIAAAKVARDKAAVYKDAVQDEYHKQKDTNSHTMDYNIDPRDGVSPAPPTDKL